MQEPLDPIPKDLLANKNVRIDDECGMNNRLASEVFEKVSKKSKHSPL